MPAYLIVQGDINDEARQKYSPGRASANRAVRR
jgi:hypothetical protein